MFCPMKGHTVLTIAVSVLLVAGASAQAKPAWFGTWSLNFSKSTQSDSTQYKRVTSRIEPWNDGLKVTYEMVGVRGGVTHWEWVGKFDGKDSPVQGTDTFLTNAYRKIDDASYEIVVKVDGAVAAVSRVTISADGNSLNVVTEGNGTKTTSVYERRH
jgi:flagellar hook assembly protein FlgD